MTNTLNTPIESLENEYPVVIEEYSLRPPEFHSETHHSGGRGVCRVYRFLTSVEALSSPTDETMPRGVYTVHHPVKLGWMPFPARVALGRPSAAKSHSTFNQAIECACKHRRADTGVLTKPRPGTTIKRHLPIQV